MKNVCAIVISALLLSLPLWSQKAPDGADLFKVRCGACHGFKGEGALAGKIPALKGTPLTAEKITALLAKGMGGKTVHASPIVNLNDEEVKAVIKTVKDLK